MAAKKSSRKRKKPAAGKAKDNHEFVAEAEEILEHLLEDLSDLEEQRHAKGEIDPDLVNRIFRWAHSLKGLAGMFGLDAISALAHRLEDILEGLRLGRISIDSPAIALLDDGVVLLAAMMADLERDDASEADAAETAQAFISRIEAAIEEPRQPAPDELDGLEIDPSLLRALTEYEEHRLRENIHRGRDISLVDSTFEMASFDEGLAELSAAVREVGEVVSTLPSPGDAPESQIRFSLLVATDIDVDRLRNRLDDPNTKVESVRRGQTASDSGPAIQPGDSGERVESRNENATTRPRPGGGAGRNDAPEIESLRSISDTIRVDVRKLDELMTLVGELVIQRNAVAGIASRLSADSRTSRIGTELSKTNKALERKLKELQSGVLDVRMVPLRQILERLSRVVRRLRRDLAKEVELEFKGADTEMDKLIVEQLVDPLVHIVRNSFDHALESPEERIAAGKSIAGLIRVSAFQRGNHVVIEVEDDGRGVDVEAIRAKALASGLITEGEVPSRQKLLNFVFEAGFSTCDDVSVTSGRGVGMDVVRSNLAEVGGMVELASTAGRGTTVTITLPITLAIIQALIVRIGSERFAIPINSVLETMAVEPSQIGRSEGREVFNLRGDPLLLRRLADEFEIEGAGREESQFAVVLGIGEQRLGLLVDGLEGQRDTVIKPIKGPIQGIRGFSGATELEDHGAILVLDVSAIVADTVRSREAA